MRSFFLVAASTAVILSFCPPAVAERGPEYALIQSFFVAQNACNALKGNAAARKQRSGWSPEENKKICAGLEEVKAALAEEGFCYGRTGEPVRDFDWHECEADSLRIPGAKYPSQEEVLRKIEANIDKTRCIMAVAERAPKIPGIEIISSDAKVVSGTVAAPIMVVTIGFRAAGSTAQYKYMCGWKFDKVIMQPM